MSECNHNFGQGICFECGVKTRDLLADLRVRAEVLANLLKQADNRAKQAAIDEREACAQLCETIARRRHRLARKLTSPDLVIIASECASTARTLADAIRAREASPASPPKGAPRSPEPDSAPEREEAPKAQPFAAVSGARSPEPAPAVRASVAGAESGSAGEAGGAKGAGSGGAEGAGAKARCPSCDNRGWYYTAGSSSYGRERCACKAPLNAIGEAQVGKDKVGSPPFVDLGADFFERMMEDDT